jgi:hypothetical protein
MSEEIKKTTFFIKKQSDYSQNRHLHQPTHPHPFSNNGEDFRFFVFAKQKTASAEYCEK